MMINPQFEEEGVQMEIRSDCCAPDICNDFIIGNGEDIISFRLLRKNAIKLAKTILDYLETDLEAE